nr:acyltransferase [Micromonospora sp. DSM 115978]
VVALVATICIWATVDGESEGLYAGGFLAVAITVALLVAAIVEVPNGVASRILTLPPLPYIGKISYGLYLWHWPVFLTLTAGRTGVSGTGLLLLRLAVTFAITIASFHLVENPIRRGTFRIRWPRIAVPATVAGVLAVVVVATSGSGNVTTPADFEAMAEEAVAEAAP